ncbi:MAG: hypothetical protein HYV35_08040 [Lentisphaerae bacterium]|nr:hypothetical protein [Lentisphaerota bacterium]
MPAAPETVRFMMDHMVIKLGKYLRILGYDAVWDSLLRTHALIARANAEGRVFVTRNTHLKEQFPPVARAVLLTEAEPVLQLSRLIAELKLETKTGLFSKCIRCNMRLEIVADPAAIRDRVHPNVFARHKRFFTCPVCRTVFWHGSHVRNTCQKLFGEAAPADII